MKIVGVTRCMTGIAHTFIAKEKLEDSAKELGHEIKIEAQGTGGIEDALTEEDIKEADAVIIAADTKIKGKERFKGKPVVEVPIKTVMKSPKSLINTVAKKINK
ncbi:PTS fructose transporter subunit IIB [Maledivibacter halophilus]|uniref:PTS system IIB component, Fru family (TC 4.A.2) n=1 Tax=Maledivibacter halophilus TaxID=36842 RepID=A0A1T5M8I2_9FIRM|nr:PTS fructose transporter subunit IIB [Maledivibacter halophilus]SKC84552.1 PTS system IIB component, Fru family (TC 4.A.2) [Maledivibacter halophilus]